MRDARKPDVTEPAAEDRPFKVGPANKASIMEPLIADVLPERGVSEDALAKAREEGAQKARVELGERHRAELQKAKAMYEAAAKEARDAELRALSEALNGLFSQYDSWLDKLFQASLLPLIADNARAAALEEFKSKLLESAERKAMPVKITGPKALVDEMRLMLEGHGLAIEVREDESSELCAKLDKQRLETRLSRVEALLSAGLGSPLEARDA